MTDCAQTYGHDQPVAPWPTDQNTGHQLFRAEWWGGCPSCVDDDYWCGSEACKKVPEWRLAEYPMPERCQTCGNVLQNGDCPWFAGTEETWAECNGCGTLFPLLDGITAHDETDESVGLYGWAPACPGCPCRDEGASCTGHAANGRSCEDGPYVYQKATIDPFVGQSRVA